jgi:hypothetical protein
MCAGRLCERVVVVQVAKLLVFVLKTSRMTMTLIPRLTMRTLTRKQARAPMTMMKGRSRVRTGMNWSAVLLKMTRNGPVVRRRKILMTTAATRPRRKRANKQRWLASECSCGCVQSKNRSQNPNQVSVS